MGRPISHKKNKFLQCIHLKIPNKTHLKNKLVTEIQLLVNTLNKKKRNYKKTRKKSNPSDLH
jgi:hypothetical protein